MQTCLQQTPEEGTAEQSGWPLVADTQTDSASGLRLWKCILQTGHPSWHLVSEAQATATTTWPEDSLHHTSKPEALGGWPKTLGAAREYTTGDNRERDPVESMNSQHWGGLLRDPALSCQSCDLISLKK